MEKIRYGVIGIKGIGRYHCRSAHASTWMDLQALCDVDESFVVERAAQVGVAAFTDFRQMLQADVVDAVSIAVPHCYLAPIALECLRAGVHVFLEKPMAMKLSDADRLIVAAQDRNLKLCVGFQYRTFDTPQILKSVIESGQIGRVQRVLWTWNAFRCAGYYEKGPWRSTWAGAGGGMLMYHAAHDIDLLCWLLGQPVEVSAMLGRQLHDLEVDDIACANIRFESGALVTLQATINQTKACNVRQISGDKGILTLPEVHSLNDNEVDDIRLGTYDRPTSELIHQDHGHLEQPPLVWKQLRRRPSPRGAFWQRKMKGAAYRLQLMQRPPLNRVGLPAMMESFAQAIFHDCQPLVNGEQARTAVELINAMHLSAFRGKTVKLPLDAVEYDELFDELATGKISVSRA